MRGTPYIFQGEELGQTINDFTSIDQFRDVESLNYYKILQERGLTPEEAFTIVRKRSRDDGRTPMAWDDSTNGGFTTGTPWLGLTGNYTYINAAAEMQDSDSIRAYTKKLIRIRKDEPVIQVGDVRFVDSPSDKVIAYERSLGDTKVLVQCNFSGEEQPALSAEGAERLIGNYNDVSSTLRPWEARAQIWC